jgi:predicted Zn-dependent protease
VAEARNRAEQIGRIYHTDSLSYLLMRERLRSLVGNPEVAREYYSNLLKNGAGLSVEERYGRAVADINARDPAAAIPDLLALLKEYPKVTQFYGALGQAYLATGQLKESQAVLDRALILFPRNVPITIRLADTLMHAGDNKRAQLILDDLFNQVEPTPNQAKLIAKAANEAGNIADSYYYMADFYLMSGDLLMASNQLQMGLGLPGLNPIQRARISAMLEEVRAAMPKNRKNTVADDSGNSRH